MVVVASRLAIVAGLLLAACQERSAVPTQLPAAEAARFIGHALPSDATDVRAAGEAGVDRLVLVRFDASATSSAAFAQALVGGAVPGSDPGLGYLGEGLDWWPAAPPAGSAGGEGRGEANRTIKLLVAPAAGDRRTVYVAAFSS